MTRDRQAHMPRVERVMQTLSVRDWAILDTVHRLRIVSGHQLERLHFTDLSERSRPVMRWRVLKRLTDNDVLAPLERRIGTAQRGSAGLCFTLDSVGQRLVQLRANAESPDERVRRPRLPGERFVAHTLAVSELYVALIEHSRIGRFTLDHFQVEPAAWVRDGLGGWLKPDAFAKLRHGEVKDFWWIEADLATESLPTVRRKLLIYLDFLNRGQLGPDAADQVVPWVLIGVPTRERRTAVQRVVNSLPEPATYMFHVAELADATGVMTQVLQNE